MITFVIQNLNLINQGSKNFLFGILCNFNLLGLPSFDILIIWFSYFWWESFMDYYFKIFEKYNFRYKNTFKRSKFKFWINNLLKKRNFL